MLQLLALFAAVGFVNLLFVALQVVAFKVARFPVDQIGFGLPFLLKRRVNGVELEIGPVPTLAFVYSLAWKEASRGKRALTAVAPWLAIGCIPLVLRTRAGAQPRAFDVTPPDPRRARQRARSRAPRRALATARSARAVRAVRDTAGGPRRQDHRGRQFRTLVRCERVVAGEAPDVPEPLSTAGARPDGPLKL